MDRSSSNRNRTRVWVTVAAAVMLLCAGLLATETSASALPAWQDQATSWTHPAARSPKVVNLRFAAHRTFDRVVIDIVGRIPSGRAHYARRFHYDASGELVPIRGRSGIALALSPARAHDGNGNVYEGPRVARPPNVQGVALAVFSIRISWRMLVRAAVRSSCASLSCPVRSVMSACALSRSVGAATSAGGW